MKWGSPVKLNIFMIIRGVQIKQIPLFVLQVLFSIMIFNVLMNNDLWALTIEFDPRLSWQLYYEDNIAAVSDDDRFGKISGFSNRYEPELNFNFAGSRIAITGYTRARVYRYFSEKAWDSTDRDYSIESIFTLNPVSTLTFGANYSLNTDPERYFEDESGGILVRKSQNITKMYNGIYTHKFSQRSTVSFIFNYLIFFTEASSGSPLYSYNVMYDYILSRKNSVNLSIGYSKLKFNYRIAEELLNFKLNTLTITGGINHNFSKTLKMNLSVGWYSSNTKSEQAVYKEDPVTGEQVFAGIDSESNTTPGSNFNVKLEKQYYHTTLSFNGNQSLYTDPESGRTNPRRRFGFMVRYDFSSKLSSSLRWTYYRNKASAGDYNNRTSRDYQSNSITFQILYRYKRNIDLMLGYIRTEGENKFTDVEIVRNNIWLRCDFSLQRPFIVG